MEKLYNDIGKIVTMDDLATKGSIGDHLGKLLEESGEFAKEANKLNGRKTRGTFESTTDIRKKLTMEAADTIQCVMAITAIAGVKYEELIEALQESNKGYQEWVDQQVKDVAEV